MTADEARAMTKKATSPDPEHVRIVLGLWYDGIKKAADAGRTSVRASELDNVRMPIQPAARRAAIDQLRADGFAAREVEDGRNETTWEVSWAAPEDPKKKWPPLRT